MPRRVDKKSGILKRMPETIGAGYGNRTRLCGLGSDHSTDELTLHRSCEGIIANQKGKFKPFLAEVSKEAGEKQIASESCKRTGAVVYCDYAHLLLTVELGWGDDTSGNRGLQQDVAAGATHMWLQFQRGWIINASTDQEYGGKKTSCFAKG